MNDGGSGMRAEIETMVDEIKQAVSLLRRHL
ncbi:peptide chain release factor 2 [Aureimonas sp. Leaf460]|nr:peptide chain release factor 2 [Aureimonas sp. Leaf427]KQT79290.1 peptide chain release factor 2 [Aureimonas sp. Leaf460]